MHRFFARKFKKIKIWLWWFILWEEWFSIFQNAVNRFRAAAPLLFCPYKEIAPLFSGIVFFFVFNIFAHHQNAKWTLRSISHYVTISHKVQSLSIFRFHLRRQSSPIRYPCQGCQSRRNCRSYQSWRGRRRSCQHRCCSVSRFQRAADEVKLVKLNSTDWLRSPRYFHL